MLMINGLVSHRCRNNLIPIVWRLVLLTKLALRIDMYALRSGPVVDSLAVRRANKLISDSASYSALVTK